MDLVDSLICVPLPEGLVVHKFLSSSLPTDFPGPALSTNILWSLPTESNIWIHQQIFWVPNPPTYFLRCLPTGLLVLNPPTGFWIVTTSRKWYFHYQLFWGFDHTNGPSVKPTNGFLGSSLPEGFGYCLTMDIYMSIQIFLGSTPPISFGWNLCYNLPIIFGFNSINGFSDGTYQHKIDSITNLYFSETFMTGSLYDPNLVCRGGGEASIQWPFQPPPPLHISLCSVAAQGGAFGLVLYPSTHVLVCLVLRFQTTYGASWLSHGSSSSLMA